MSNLRKERKDNNIKVPNKQLQTKKTSFPFFLGRYEMKKTAARKIQGNSCKNTRLLWNRKLDPWAPGVEAGAGRAITAIRRLYKERR